MAVHATYMKTVTLKALGFLQNPEVSVWQRTGCGNNPTGNVTMASNMVWLGENIVALVRQGTTKKDDRQWWGIGPALELSVFEDLRATSKPYGQARQGQKVTHSLVRLNLELKLCTPEWVNLLHLWKAAHIMEKSLGPSQLRKRERIANSAPGVTGCLHIRGDLW